MAQMTKEMLIESCKKNGGYAAPRLNDQLYLQCRGFRRIENLQPYINLKALWLEQNGIEVIEGLGTLSNLCSLFLQNNAIRRIHPDSLRGLSNLRQLNLSNNYLTRIEHIAVHCPCLESLQLAHNCIATLSKADCGELLRIEELSSVDLSANKIESLDEPSPEDDAPAEQEGESALTPETESKPKGSELAERLVAFISNIPKLSVLYFSGNEIVPKVRNYRKHLIAGLPELQYLDERPVFPEERRAVNAWIRGGEAEERAERQKISQEKKEHLTQCVTAMMDLKNDPVRMGERDRRQREWEALQEEKKKWYRQKAIDDALAQSELETEETQARGDVEEQRQGEHDAQLLPALEIMHVNLERERVYANVHSEINREINSAPVETGASPPEDVDRQRAQEAEKENAAAESRRYWLSKLIEEDESVEKMQRDLDDMISALVPGPAPERPAAAAVAAPPAVAEKPPPTKEVKPKKKKGTTGDPSGLWESYYAFEMAYKRKRQAARTE